MKTYKTIKSNFELAEIACLKGINCLCDKTGTTAEFADGVLTITDKYGVNKFLPQMPTVVFDKKGRSRTINFRPFSVKL